MKGDTGQNSGVGQIKYKSPVGKEFIFLAMRTQGNVNFSSIIIQCFSPFFDKDFFYSCI